MDMRVGQETPEDIGAIEAVTIAAFADAPHTSHTEQFIVRALRDASELTLSIVAEEHGQVVGHVALSPVRAADPQETGQVHAVTVLRVGSAHRRAGRPA